MIDSEYIMDIYKSIKISMGTVMKIPEMINIRLNKYVIKLF